MSFSSKAVLLPAVKHADVMGRYLKLIPDELEGSLDDDGGSWGASSNGNANSTVNAWKGSGIVFDWPGVQLTFQNVRNTTTVKIKMRGGLSVFGYRVVPCISADKNENDGDIEDEDDRSHDKVLNTYGFWGISNTEREYELATNLDPQSSYKVQIWKQDDPGNGVVKIVGLVVDNGGAADEKQKKEGDGNDSTNNTRRRTIEFVGDADVLGFLNMTNTTTRRMSALFLAPVLTLGGPRMRKGTDVSKAWPVLVAKELNRRTKDVVDWQIIAKTEICCAKYQDEYPSMAEVYAYSMYDEWRVLQSGDRDGKSLSPVDAVCLYIGQDDQGALGGQFMKNTERLVDGFLALLNRIRQVRGPKTKVVVIVPTWDCVLSRIGSEKGRAFTASSQNDLWKQAVQQMGGEEKNFFVVENQHDPQIALGGRDDFGLMLQWNASSHSKFAAGLADKLKPILDFSWKDGS
mmetsp:Transcript_21178/g.50348  ORF Transcript_21178/g.50348 Transcript_21178/m.50348 type:complete len:460 (+) Transcript_21178:473-1852(+)